MENKLANLSLEELWQLFPIELKPHNTQWKIWAETEMKSLMELLSDYRPAITHIGSTAIASIMAKPIIDILIEISSESILTTLKSRMESGGYICMNTLVNRMSFNKGYTLQGYAEKVFHIHIHPYGDNDEILFRDYLSKNHETAQAYERLKLSLLSEYRNNRDGYTAAKTDFVEEIIALARKSWLKPVPDYNADNIK